MRLATAAALVTALNSYDQVSATDSISVATLALLVEVVVVVLLM